MRAKLDLDYMVHNQIPKDQWGQLKKQSPK